MNQIDKPLQREETNYQYQKQERGEISLQILQVINNNNNNNNGR